MPFEFERHILIFYEHLVLVCPTCQILMQDVLASSYGEV
jgi:hypothetical protein